MKKIVVVAAVLLLAGGAWAGGYPEVFNHNNNVITNNNDSSALAISGASASAKSDVKVFNSQAQSQYQSQSQGQIQAQNNGQTISPSQSISFDGNTYLGEYPTPFTTPMPNMQAPTAPKSWQLSLSLWADGDKWGHDYIAKDLPPNVDKYGRVFKQPLKKGDSVTVYKKAPKNYVRLGTYVVVAKNPTVDATVLEDAAMWQAKQDGASGIVERERHFFAKNNYKGSSGGAGLALSILGSIANGAAMFGPNAGFQSGSYSTDQDIYAFIAFDTIEVR